jgi:TetR/AcrR family transcriptional regulator of autoinduction and epiphytic fitness
MAEVKHEPRRTRRQRAAATRQKIIESAHRLFLEQGYQVTMEAIAADAGVAVQTVYFVFHTKATLLRDVISFAAAEQHDAAPVMERPWITEALRSEDARRVLALSMEHGTDIFARVAPLAAALEAAAQSDPEVAAHVRDIGQARREGMGKLVQRLADQGWLRDGLAVDRAADIMFTVHSHATYRILVLECGWDVAEYKAWQYHTLCDQLLSERARVTTESDPISGPSFRTIDHG